MDRENEKVGSVIAKGIRGCSAILCMPVIVIATGFAVGQRMGWALGCLAAVGSLMVGMSLIVLMLRVGKSGLSVLDCFAPFVLSLFAAVAFAPISLFAGNLFSVATCTMAGLLMTLSLFVYRTGKCGPGFLIMPFLTFVYEMLPIDLPTDIDNFLALSGSGLSNWLAYAKIRLANDKGGNRLARSEPVD